MDCLVLGRSRFAERRVLPALDGLAAVRVASRRAGDDYQAALDALPPPALVYVSLTNDAHARWAEAALDRGHHVVVDKPAFLDLATAKRLTTLARTRSLVLAEATTYAFHPLFDDLRRIFAEHGGAPTHLTCALCPVLPAENFRFRRALGGGALLDLGPYAASLGRIIWGAAPEAIAATALLGEEVDTSFSLLARYPAGVLVGHFGFTTEYRNWLHLLGPGLSVEVTGAFSAGPEGATEIRVRHRDALSTVVTPPASAMRRFLTAVFAAVAAGDTVSFAETLLADARARHQLQQAVAQPEG